MTYDTYGDPLPPGAQSRLGTLRMMQPFSVDALAFSGDGRFVATSGDGIRIFEVETGRRVGILREFKGSNRALAFAPDGRRLASVGDGRSLRVWGLDENGVPTSDTSMLNIPLEHDEGRDVLWLGPGLLAVGAYMNVRLFRCDGAEPRAGDVHDCQSWIRDLRAFPEAGGWLLYVSTERDLWRLRVASGGTIAKAERMLEETREGLAVSTDGQLLAGSVGPAVWIRRGDTGALVRELAVEGGVSCLDFSPDGRRLLVSAHSRLELFDVETGEHLRTFAEQHYDIAHARFSPDGTRILSAQHRGQLRCFRGDGAEERAPWPRHGDSISSFSFSRDGALTVTADDGGELRAWRTADGACLWTRPAEKESSGQVVLSPRGDIVAAALDNGRIRVLDTGDGTPAYELSGGDGWIRILAFSRDGRYLAACERDARMHLWDLEALRTDRKPNASVSVAIGTHLSDLVFSADGSVLASCGGNLMGLWRVPRLEPLHQLGEGVCQLGFMGGGRVVGFCADSFARVWDVERGQEVHRQWYAGSRARVSPSGAFVALLAEDGRRITLHRSEDLSQLGSLPFDGQWPFFDFLPDGSKLAVVEDSHNLVVFPLNDALSVEASPAPQYAGAEALSGYQLRLGVLPPEAFTEARIGSGHTCLASPDDDTPGFLGMIIHLPASARRLTEEEAAALSMDYIDPPVSPVIPMCGYLNREVGKDVDIENVYVVVERVESGERERRRLVLDRPTSAQLAPDPIFDDDTGEPPRLSNVTGMRVGSWFTLNLSEHVGVVGDPGRYRVHLEHGVLETLRTDPVTIEVHPATSGD